MIVWMHSADFIDRNTSAEVFGGWNPAIHSVGAPLVRYMVPAGYALLFHRIVPSATTAVWVAMDVRFGEGLTRTKFQVGEAGVSWNLGFARNSTSGRLEVCINADGTVLGTGTIPITVDQWYRVVFQLTIHGSAGIVKVWVDGVLDLDLSGVDTLAAGGTGEVTILGWGYQGGFDNVVLASQTAPNDAPSPDVRVDCMRPNGNGDDRGWTRSAGADDYALIDEEYSTSTDSDYLSSATVGDRVCVQLAPLTNAGGTILAVQASCRAKKMDAGTAGFKLYLKTSGGSRYYSDEFLPANGTWGYFSWVWNTNPETSAAWTESAFNALQAGVEHTS